MTNQTRLTTLFTTLTTGPQLTTLTATAGELEDPVWIRELVSTTKRTLIRALSERTRHPNTNKYFAHNPPVPHFLKLPATTTEHLTGLTAAFGMTAAMAPDPTNEAWTTLPPADADTLNRLAWDLGEEPDLNRPTAVISTYANSLGARHCIDAYGVKLDSPANEDTQLLLTQAGQAPGYTITERTSSILAWYLNEKETRRQDNATDYPTHLPAANQLAIKLWELGYRVSRRWYQ